MTVQGSSLTRQFHLLSCAGYTLLCVMWSWWAGKDQNWDLLNYHLYVAQAWWQGRIPEEFFAAGPQSYLNPLAHLPFYFLIQTGWHSLVVGSLLATLHSANLWLLHAIATHLVPESAPDRRSFIVCGVLLGGLSPAFLLETGTSYIDVVVSLPALGALWSILAWQQRQSSVKPDTNSARLWLGFYLAGIAVGLKPTAIVLALALGLATLLTNYRQGLQIAWRGLIAGVSGVLLSGGAHAWMLWKAYGNPFFPMFNDHFRSPWFSTAKAIGSRFALTSLEEALRYPLDMANAFKRAGYEGIAADIRPMALIALLMIGAGIQLSARRQDETCRSDRKINKRLFWSMLTIYMGLWLQTSANLRYGIEGFLLLGLALVLAVLNVQRIGRIPLLLALTLPLVCQTTLALTLNRARTGGNGNWAQEWVSFELPPQLRDRPAYYLSLQHQSYSALVARVPAASRFTNLIGQATLSVNGPAWLKIQQEQQANNLPFRSLLEVTRVSPNGAVPRFFLQIQESMLSEYNLQADASRCEFIGRNGSSTPVLHWDTRNEAQVAQFVPGRIALVSCPLHASSPLSNFEKSRRRQIDFRFERWEQNCPADFSPAMGSTQGTTERWRNYGSLDSVLTVPADGGLYALRAMTGSNIQLEDSAGRKLIEGCPELRAIKFSQAKKR